MSPATVSPLAYLYGDDDLTLDRAAGVIAAAIGQQSGAPLERWDLRSTRADAPRQVAELHERLATAGMFGGGTLAVVHNPGALLVRNEDRDAVLAVLDLVAPGNGLVVLEAAPSGAREPAHKKLAEAIRSRGGTVRAHASPKEGALAAWIESEARDRGLRLAPGAAKELATRIGGFVREGDAERRDQTRRAAMELDKLALYRGDAEVGPVDVRELVAEAVPGSAWALADAVGNRDPARAQALLDAVSGTTPEPVLVVVLHRRIRELISAADHLASGSPPSALVRLLGLHPYRADMLTVQARRWTQPELRAALEGILDLDARVKRAPGRAVSDAARRLAFSLWIADHVAPTSERPGAGSGSLAGVAATGDGRRSAAGAGVG